jgi:radical SAM protein with 4Fe4S-binding SPASM domain
LKEWNLIDGETVAIDSFKIRGSNSLKNNFNEKKLKQHLAYIDEQISEYEAQLDAVDKLEEKKAIQEKIEERKEKQEKYIRINEELEQSGEEQISLTDPDSRAVILLRNVVNVGYNVQASSDSKHKFLTEFSTGSVNDSHALADMAIATKELLGVEHMTVLADKGYHTRVELGKCKDHDITTFVSPKDPTTKDIGFYPSTSFTYDPEKDVYICPQGHSMTTNNTWHNHSDKRKNKPGAYRFRRYNTPACKTCASRNLCTQSRNNGRYIDRSEYADIVEENLIRVQCNPDYYRKRQQITEHMFGTLKRQRGFTFTLMRGKEKVLGEVGLMFIGYNLSRCISIIGAEKLICALREHCLPGFLMVFMLISSLFKQFSKKYRFSEIFSRPNFYVLYSALFNSYGLSLVRK